MILISLSVATGLFFSEHLMIQYNHLVLNFLKLHKAELQQEGILSHTQFPSLAIFFNKKVGF